MFVRRQLYGRHGVPVRGFEWRVSGHKQPYGQGAHSDHWMAVSLHSGHSAPCRICNWTLLTSSRPRSHVNGCSPHPGNKCKQT